MSRRLHSRLYIWRKKSPPNATNDWKVEKQEYRDVMQQQQLMQRRDCCSCFFLSLSFSLLFFYCRRSRSDDWFEFFFFSSVGGPLISRCARFSFLSASDAVSLLLLLLKVDRWLHDLLLILGSNSTVFSFDSIFGGIYCNNKWDIDVVPLLPHSRASRWLIGLFFSRLFYVIFFLFSLSFSFVEPLSTQKTAHTQVSKLRID